MAEININDLNAVLSAPKEAIRLAEEEYHEKITRVAKRVSENPNIKVILLAGPSGSGKTTTANLISDKLKSLGEASMVVSLDDFYRDQSDPQYPRFENGEPDYECPEALNLPQISETIKKITNNEAFSIPKYDFKVGGRVQIRDYAPIGHGCVIIEGLHALNPKIWESLDKSKILKIFVSVSTNVNEGSLRIISGRKIRFIRRMVRDSIYRGADAERTLAMWRGVLAAEDIYLYPYKETADIAFNTFHSFELGAMKPFVEKLISKSLCEKEPYAKTVLSALNKVCEIDHTLIPQNSLIREFIPGGIYEALY